MSGETTIDSTNPTTEQATEQAPEWTYDPSLPGDDNSRVDDPEAMLALVPEWEKLAERAVTEAKRYRGATSALAVKRVEARSHVILANGFPDWAADSDAYKQAVRAAESSAMAKLTKQAGRDLGNATKQQVRRVALLPGVVGWILTHENGFGDEAAVWADDRDAILSGPSDKLKNRVRAHYAAAGLKLEHPAFREKVADTSAGPGNEPTNPLETFRGGLGTLEQITPRFSVSAILETTSAVCAALIESRGGEIEGRTEIMEQLARIATLAMETASALDTTHGGKYDEQGFKVALFDGKKDTPAA